MPTHVEIYGCVKVDKDGRISRELSCIDCGYELRGCDPASTCPECGSLINRSFHSKVPPLNHLRRAGFWIAVAMLVVFILMNVIVTV